LIAALTAFFSVCNVARAVRLVVRRERQGRAASLTLAGLGLLWLAAFALFYAAVRPWLTDQDSAIFTYPGGLFPIACWGLFAATLATPIAAVIALGPLRPAGWSWWRWTQQGAALIVFASLGATLFAWGLLGYSGW
jgi:hypothetical protein